MTRRPTTERYLRLVDRLLAADRLIEDGETHSLAAAILALEAVNGFIGDDPNLRVNGISKTLRQLAAALHDTEAGGKPKMLFDGTPNRGRGRRTGLINHHLRGAIVFSMDTLMDAGMKRVPASKAVESLLRKYRVRFGDKDILAKTIVQWREEVGVSNPPATDQAIARIQQMHQTSRLPNTPEMAMQIADGLIKRVSWHNSR